MLKKTLSHIANQHTNANFNFTIDLITSITSMLYTGSYKSIPIYNDQKVKNLKVHLNILYWTKERVVNMSHSGVQKYTCYKNGINSLNISYTGSHKKLRILLFYV